MTETASRQEGTMRVWAVMSKEFGSEAFVLVDRTETGDFQEMVFADSAYAQAVERFNQARDERLSFHEVNTVGTFGPAAHAHLIAFDGDDEVELRPITVIGG